MSTPSTPSFEGFVRPQANFYRLPITWFDTLRVLREQHERRRIVALIRLTEYVIKWTWGQGNFDGGVRLTLDELHSGKVSSRVDGTRVRLDLGTGLPHKTLLPTIDDALSFGLLTRTKLTDDRARVKNFYAVAQAPDDPAPAQPGPPFTGFARPQTNYFIVPKYWTDLIAGVASETLILSVEYLFRHCWNWSRVDEAHWLNVDEIAHGRLSRNNNNANPTRYDQGIAYSERKVRDALAEAVTREWIVWRTNYSYDDMRPRTEFTLRREGWAAGQHPSPPLPGVTEEQLQESLARHYAIIAPPSNGSSYPQVVADGPKVTAERLLVTTEEPVFTLSNGPKVTVGGPKVTAEGLIFTPPEGLKVTIARPKVTVARPKVTVARPKVTTDQLYQLNIPTKEKNPGTPTPPASRARAENEHAALNAPENGGVGVPPYFSSLHFNLPFSHQTDLADENALGADLKITPGQPGGPPAHVSPATAPPVPPTTPGQPGGPSAHVGPATAPPVPPASLDKLTAQPAHVSPATAPPAPPAILDKLTAQAAHAHAMATVSTALVSKRAPVQVNAPASTPRTRYSYDVSSHGPHLSIDAPAWPDAWTEAKPLHPTYVLVGDPNSQEPLAILSLQDTAELLWKGLPRDWIVWDPDWLDVDEIPANSNDWAEDARRRENTVDDLVYIMQTNSDLWGHWDLATALRLQGIAPERAQELLRAHGRSLVGAWLKDLRGDPSVHSVPGLLISNLRKGLTPPSLVRSPKQYGAFDGTS